MKSYTVDEIMATQPCYTREPAVASWDAVEVSRKYADGEATKEDLSAARIAAYSASAAFAEAYAGERNRQVAAAVEILEKQEQEQNQ